MKTIAKILSGVIPALIIGFWLGGSTSAGGWKWSIGWRKIFSLFDGGLALFVTFVVIIAVVGVGLFIFRDGKVTWREALAWLITLAVTVALISVLGWWHYLWSSVVSWTTARALGLIGLIALLTLTGYGLYQLGHLIGRLVVSLFPKKSAKAPN